MIYIHSLLSRPWFSYRPGTKPSKNDFEAEDAIKSSGPRSKQQEPPFRTVNEHAEDCGPDTRSASRVEVVAAAVQSGRSLQGSSATGQSITDGNSAASASKQAAKKAAVEDHVDLSGRTSIQLVEQKQTAPGYDTAAIQLADEQLRSSHARQIAGSESDSARTDGVPLHGQDSAAEGLTLVAQGRTPNGAQQQSILAIREQEEDKLAAKQVQRSFLPSSKRQVAKALNVGKPLHVNPHSSLQGKQHALQARIKKLTKGKSASDQKVATTNKALADVDAKLLEVCEEQQCLEAKSASLMQLMRSQYRDDGLQPDEVERETNTFIEAAAEAARQKQTQAAARAAEFEAAALAWLLEPSAPPSQSRLKGRKAHAGRASQSKELKQAPQQQDADDSTEASLDDDAEEVIRDITPNTVEAHDQLTNSSFASGHAGARRLAPITPRASSTPHQIAQSAPCHVVAQRQSDSIRLENLSKRALADWKVLMREHRARVHIDHQPNNLLNDKDLRIFTPRDEELLLRPGEVWKLDLHTPQWLRERGCSLEATLAGDAVEVYLKILQTYLFEFLPGAGNTVVTGRERGTGGRTFIEVGQILFRLLGTVVSRYTAHQDWGAYTVWLLCPSKADRRLRMIQ